MRRVVRGINRLRVQLGVAVANVVDVVPLPVVNVPVLVCVIVVNDLVLVSVMVVIVTGLSR